MTFETIWGQCYCKYWFFTIHSFISHCRLLLGRNRKLHIQTTTHSSCWFPFRFNHATWCSMTVSYVETRTHRGRKKIREGRAFLRRMWHAKALFWERGVMSSLPLLSLCFKSSPVEQWRVSTVPYGPPPQSCSPMPPLLLQKKKPQWWKASTDMPSHATGELLTDCSCRLSQPKQQCVTININTIRRQESKLIIEPLCFGQKRRI